MIRTLFGLAIGLVVSISTYYVIVFTHAVVTHGPLTGVVDARVLMCSIALCAFVGGFVAARLATPAPLRAAAACAILLWLAAAAGPLWDTPWWLLAFILVYIGVAAVFGGVLGYKAGKARRPAAA
jgi:hypothetical protein